MFDRTRKIVDRLVGLSALVGALALVVTTMVVIADVIGRYFGAPLYGAQDIVQMSALFVVFGGMAYCERRGGHISVDLLEASFSPAFNKKLTIIGSLLGALVFALIAWQTFEAIKLSHMLNMATNILYLPRAPFQYAIGTLTGITSLAMAVTAMGLILEKPDNGSDSAAK
ncbi:MAG: TRAP transporter small permease [Rhizobiales bacterium]|nr:TRAP transporter small permease [Hyphomicrobiales bacterium]